MRNMVKRYMVMAESSPCPGYKNPRSVTKRRMQAVKRKAENFVLVRLEALPTRKTIRRMQATKITKLRNSL
jgi:hypothetical protein